ncbi:RseA family anti-sigma factor [Lysobacter cavernae]|uniref:RseA family anti-sigma factor n=1 Tax=Lysobacter cavernae TaxID=1685901 RepID=A0ABV7RSP6_9GAMM
MSNTRSFDDRQTSDHEVLSALFDGELDGDAARFALKRLGHDAQWRQACGRWQLCGDVLRGEATGIAAGGFAERVAAAIALETVHVQAVAPAVSAPVSRRGWIGGALAASVAVAALFVVRPFSSDPSDPVLAGAPAPAQVASTAPAPPVPVQEASVPPVPDASIGLAAAAVAVAEVPRRAAERRTSRGQSQRAALRAPKRQLQRPAVAAAVTAPALAVASNDTGNAATALPAKPFLPQHNEIVTRPWPRAVLPQAAAAGLTASYGNGAAAAQSFYPFEPSLQAPPDASGTNAAVDVPGPQP